MFVSFSLGVIKTKKKRAIISLSTSLMPFGCFLLFLYTPISISQCAYVLRRADLIPVILKWNSVFVECMKSCVQCFRKGKENFTSIQLIKLSVISNKSVFQCKEQLKLWWKQFPSFFLHVNGLKGFYKPICMWAQWSMTFTSPVWSSCCEEGDIDGLRWYKNTTGCNVK